MPNRSTTWPMPTAAPSPMLGRLHELAVTTSMRAACPSTDPARAITDGPSTAPMWWLRGEGLIRNSAMTVFGRVIHGRSDGKSALMQGLYLDTLRSGRGLVFTDEAATVEAFDCAADHGQTGSSPAFGPALSTANPAAVDRGQGW